MTSLSLTSKASAEVRRYRKLYFAAPEAKRADYLHALGASVLADLDLQDARAGRCRHLSPEADRCAAIHERGNFCPYRQDEAVSCPCKDALPADMAEYRRTMHAAKASRQTGDARWQNLAENVAGEGRP